MNNIIDHAFSAEAFRMEGHKLIDQLADYMGKQIIGENENATRWREPEEMYSYWKDIFSNPEIDFQTIVAHTLNNSIHLHNPRYIGHQVAVPAPHIILSELVTAAINNSTALYEMAMSATAIEKLVIEWAIKKFNYPETAGGVLTSGGSLGALTALLAARQKMADYDVWEEGMNQEGNLTMFVSEEAHYSLARAAKILGFGNNVIKVVSNKNCQLDLESLSTKYSEAMRQNRKPIAVIASACTTSTGSYDDINRIADFCEENNLWLHVDGAHGAGVILSGKYKNLVEGISRADSIVMDFHKMLLCPSLVTAVLFKRNDDSFNSFKQKASYLWDSHEENEWYNGGKRTIECTRKVMAFKIFVALKIFKEDLFTEYIESRYDIAKEFALLIKKQSDFELALEPQSNIVCFRYVPCKHDDNHLDQLNSRIRKALLDDGKFYIVKTIVHERTYLRVTIMNPFTAIAHFKELLDEIRKTFNVIERNNHLL